MSDQSETQSLKKSENKLFGEVRPYLGILPAALFPAGAYLIMAASIYGLTDKILKQYNQRSILIYLNQ